MVSHAQYPQISVRCYEVVIGAAAKKRLMAYGEFTNGVLSPPEFGI